SHGSDRRPPGLLLGWGPGARGGRPAPRTPPPPIPPPPAVTGNAGDPQHAATARIDGQSHIPVVGIESEQNVDASPFEREADRLESRPPHLSFDFSRRERAGRRRDAARRPGHLARPPAR